MFPSSAYDWTEFLRGFAFAWCAGALLVVLFLPTPKGRTMWRVFTMKAFPFDGIEQPIKCYPYRTENGGHMWSVVDDDALKFDSLNAASEFVRFIKSEFPECEFSIERIP